MKKMIGLIVTLLVMVWAAAGSAQTNLIIGRDQVTLGADLWTDRWLNSDTNTFLGMGVASAGQLTRTSDPEGWYNTALGFNALYSNTTGHDNVAIGYQALFKDTSGDRNTAIGSDAMYANMTGYANTVTGAGALQLNVGGYENTVAGVFALANNINGSDNVAIGDGALIDATGSNNTAIGHAAGSNTNAGNYNIYIGSNVSGTSSDNYVIRIGSVQTTTSIAGIYGAGIAGNTVYVNSNGQLGTIASSRRFKEDIQKMGEASSWLMKLRPVTFHYKAELDNGERLLQYGLIAEEVAEVYPELIQYGQSGEPLTVRYHELGPMLLNEVQKQQERVQKQAEQIFQLTQALSERDARIQRLEKLIEEVQERVSAMETPAKTVVSK
jgi:hypothetical protein